MNVQASRRYSVPLLLVPVLICGLVGCGGSHDASVTGTAAGGLDAGSEVGFTFPLKRGDWATVALIIFQNNGDDDARIEDVQPISSSPDLRLTHGRVWVMPEGARMGLPTSWPGWPAKGYSDDLPLVSSLPEKGAKVPPHAHAQLAYGVKLNADAGPRSTAQVKSVRVRFRQGDTTYTWTIPETVGVQAK